MPSEEEGAAQLICRVIIRKEWYQATEAEKEKCRKVWREVDAIAHNRFPAPSKPPSS